MTDHPVLIPTSEGAVGGIVSASEKDPRAALILIPGYGRPARSGVNSFWTRTARSLAELGIVVLRIDCSREGETLPIGERGPGGQVWKKDLDLSLLRQVAPWFCERTGGAPLHLAGACSGARLAIELAGREPEAVDGTYLIVPYLRELLQNGAEPGDSSAVDPLFVRCMQAILARKPSWILVGEHDTSDVALLAQLVGPTVHDLEVEVVAGAALHLLDQPAIQEQVGHRLTTRLASVCATH